MVSGVKLIMMKLVSFPSAIMILFQLISRQRPFIHNFLSITIFILCRNYVRHILEKLHSVMLSFVIAHICAYHYVERNMRRTDNSILSPHFRRQIRFTIATCVDVSLRLKSEFSEHLNNPCHFITCTFPDNCIEANTNLTRSAVQTP